MLGYGSVCSTGPYSLQFITTSPSLKTRVKLYAMGRIVKCRRIGCNNTFPKSEGRGRPQKYCRHACMIAAFRRRHRHLGKLPRSGNSTHNNDDEWYTPPEIIEACRAAMGGIDLDPASHEVANRCVKADRYFTAEDDGLAQEWSGRVFLNPPYSKLAGKAAFISKLAAAFDVGSVTAATVVLSYDFSASWFEPLRGRYAGICLCRGRVQFYKETPGDGHDPALGTSIVYLGPDVPAFTAAVGTIGDIVVRPHTEPYPGRRSSLTWHPQRPLHHAGGCTCTTPASGAA